MRSVVSILVVIVVTATTAAAQTQTSGSRATLTGVVRDATGGVLPGTIVTARGSDGQATSVSADNGAYRLDASANQLLTIEFALPNFAVRRLSNVLLRSDETRVVDVTLSLVLSADVVVTGQRTFRHVAELQSAEGGLIGIASTASEGLITGRQLEARPLMRAGEILETVPGLVVSQHSGEGKANQYYLRGFNLDHGTDFATSIAGVPVNLPTHAHGQGYSDINFLIPELVSAVQFQKGLYSAEQGDFSTAGASHVRYATTLEAPVVRISGGGDGWRRLVAAVSPAVAAGHLLVALETSRNDGPWVRPDGFTKLNAVVGYSRGDVQNGVALRGMLYRGRWDATDQIPARAVASGSLSRFDGVDKTTGGDTARYSLSGDWQRTRNGGVTRASAFAMNSRLNLFSNFTYFLDDPINGDQFEQADRRWVSGGRVTHRQMLSVGRHDSELSSGAEFRRDAIGEVGLYRTVARNRLSTIRRDAVQQSSVSGFVQHDRQWLTWLRSTLGLRADQYWFDVDAGHAANAGAAAAAVVSPKAALVIGPWRNSELYLSAGRGFHSNDARGTTLTSDPVSGDPVEAVTPLASARGGEVGLRTMPARGLQITAAAWGLSLDSELVFVGDAGTTDAGRASRRYGVEVTSLYAPAPWLTLDGDVAFSRGRFRGGDRAARHIPGAVERVVAGGITVQDRGRFGGSLRLRHFGARDLSEDATVRSQPTTMFNGELVMQASAHMRVVLDAFNLFNARASDIDYFYTSRLPSEPAAGVDDVHSHPALPRSVRLGLHVAF